MLGISKEIVHQLPEVTYPGRVILIDSAAKARDAVAYLLKQRQIGFDTETRPSFQKNHRYKVSLVQLSTPGECFLFRLKMIGSLDGLVSVFENAGIQKIGLSLKDDFHSLAKLCEFTPAGFVELQTFVKNYEIADNSLQKIYALIFGKRISKNQRLTNWEASVLTEQQQRYAAIDAWACLRLYRTFRSGNFHPDESPFIVDRSQLCPSMNNQLIGPEEAARHAEAMQAAEQKRVAEAERKAAGIPSDKPARKRAARSKEAKEARKARSRKPASAKSSKSPRTPKRSSSSDK